MCLCEKRFDDKRRQNRYLRRCHKLDIIPNGSCYKKYRNFPSPWKYYWTKEQAIQDYHSDNWIQQRYTLEAWLQYWESCVRRK